MRIAFVSTMSAVPWGGSEELWAEAAEKALAKGHEVGLFLYRWAELPPRVAALRDAGAKLFLRAPRRHNRVEVALAKMSRSWAALSNFKADVICVNQGDAYDCAIDSQSRGLGQRLDGSTPFVQICHFCDDRHIVNAPIREAAKKVFGQASTVAFVAQASLNTVQRQIIGKLPNAIVVRNPVNMKEMSPVLWPEGRTRGFACVGRLEPFAKGQDQLLQALADPIWRDRDWRLRIAGTGREEAYLRELTSHYALDSRVEFCGQVSDIRSLWAKSHLLVMPSHAESAPLVVVEAMLCGRPSVVTDVGGHAEWIDDGVTGFIAPAANAKSIGAALNRAWEAQDRWREMGMAAHAAAASKIDPNPGQTLLDLLVRAADGRRSS